MVCFKSKFDGIENPTFTDSLDPCQKGLQGVCGKSVAGFPTTNYWKAFCRGL